MNKQTRNEILELLSDIHYELHRLYEDTLGEGEFPDVLLDRKGKPIQFLFDRIEELLEKEKKYEKNKEPVCAKY